MGNCLSNIFIQRGMDLIFRFLQLRQSNPSTNLSHSPNPEGPIDDIQDEIRAEGTQRVRIEVPKEELTETLLQEYLELERMARRLERKQVLSNWEIKNHLADEAMRKLVHLEARHKELKKQTEKARADLEHLEQPSIRAHLRQQGIYQSRHEKAKELVDSAIVKEETSFKELATIKAEYSRAQLVANRYREKCEKLEKAHQKQEEIFCSVNGSAEYMDLVPVRELESAQDWLQRVTLAKFKWTNGRALLIHASIQLSYGLAFWEELQQINGARSRYFTAVEARNNFVNSINNIQSCRVYLGRVRFPYVTEEEIQSMELAIQNAFNDLQSNVAIKRVLTICQGMQDKLNSLILWFDKVINQTIIRDLDKANANVEKLWTQTRELRLELLRKLVHEKLGREIEAKELDIGEEEEDDDNFEEEEVRNEELELSVGEVNNEEGEEEALNGEVGDEARGLESEDELRIWEDKSENEGVNEGNQKEFVEEEDAGGNEENLREEDKSENEEDRGIEEELRGNEEVRNEEDREIVEELKGESKNEVKEEKILEGDRRDIHKRRVIFVPNHQIASPSTSSITLSSQNLYENGLRKSNLKEIIKIHFLNIVEDVQRRIRKFEQIRYRKKNFSNIEMQRLNTLQVGDFLANLLRS
uniref:Uncharacterized protein n=1 Tax=Meloidogyne enterolobii TaxID=390850 RepID=A0A6V7V8P4_MELEN|nr:unnamed protein product [Meloidogyne enterolobii]